MVVTTVVLRAARRACQLAWLLPVLLFPSGAAAEPAIYSFGVAPQFDQRQLVTIWQPILDELARRTGLAFRLTGVPYAEEFGRRLLAGDYDFAYVNPMYAARAVHHPGYRVLVRDRAEDLYGIVVVRQDSPYRHPRDLNGKVVVFPAPNALAAALLVRRDLVERFHVAITPRYVETHTSVYLNVAKGLAEAGGGVQKTLDAEPATLRARLRVLYATSRVPAHPVVAHPRVPAAVRRQVQQALLDLGRSDAGRTLLAAVPIRRIGTASDLDYRSIEQLGLERYQKEDAPP